MRFINSVQTRDERREKYSRLKSNNFSAKVARIARDYSSNKVGEIIAGRRTVSVERYEKEK